MKLIGRIVHEQSRNDFSSGDHQEYVEIGLRDAVLIGGVALVLFGGFVASIV